MLAAAVLLSGCTTAPSTAETHAHAGTSSHTDMSPSSGRGTSMTAVADESIPSTGCGTGASAAPGQTPRTDPTPQPGQTVTDTIRSGGEKRSYVLHLPDDYRNDAPTPLILAFHARGGDGAGMAKYTGFSASDAVVAYPNGLSSQGGRSWESAPYASGTNDVAFVSELITHLQSTLCIDPDRIYAAGKSNGGGFTALLACMLPHRIAAFGIVSGAFYETDSAHCTNRTPSPIVDFHGTADPVIHYTGGTSHGTRYQGISAWLAGQAVVDGCSSDPQAGPLSTQLGDDVTRLAWTGCHGRGALVHYRIDGGGHTWPGAASASGPGKTTQTISATSIMLDFFASHPLQLGSNAQPSTP